MPSAGTKLRKAYVNLDHPSVILRFEDGHEIRIAQGKVKTFDAYTGEMIRVVAIYDRRRRSGTCWSRCAPRSCRTPSRTSRGDDAAGGLALRCWRSSARPGARRTGGGGRAPASFVRADTAALRRTLDSLAAAHRGVVGYTVHNLDTGERLERRGDETFSTASLIKVPILVTVYDLVEQGQLSLDDPLTRAQDRQGAGGRECCSSCTTARRSACATPRG